MKKFKSTSFLVDELKTLQAIEQKLRAELEKVRAEVGRKQSEIEKLQDLIKNNPELIEEDPVEVSVVTRQPQVEVIPADEEKTSELVRESAAPFEPSEAHMGKKIKRPPKDFSSLKI